MRFSVSHLLLLVAMIALACASLKFANQMWWMVLLNTALVLFPATAILGFVRRRTVFPIGVVFFVTVYSLLAFDGKGRELARSGDLVTTKVIQAAYRSIATNGGRPGTIIAQDGSARFAEAEPSEHYFMRIGHFWFALLFGWIGGLFAVWIDRQRRD